MSELSFAGPAAARTRTRLAVAGLAGRVRAWLTLGLAAGVWVVVACSLSTGRPTPGGVTPAAPDPRPWLSPVFQAVRERFARRAEHPVLPAFPATVPVAEPALRHLGELVFGALGVALPPLEVGFVAAPFVTRARGRPEVVLPAWLLGTGTLRHATVVLAHEAAHLAAGHLEAVTITQRAGALVDRAEASLRHREAELGTTAGLRRVRQLVARPIVRVRALVRLTRLRAEREADAAAVALLGRVSVTETQVYADGHAQLHATVEAALIDPILRAGAIPRWSSVYAGTPARVGGAVPRSGRLEFHGAPRGQPSPVPAPAVPLRAVLRNVEGLERALADSAGGVVPGGRRAWAGGEDVYAWLVAGARACGEPVVPVDALPAFAQGLRRKVPAWELPMRLTAAVLTALDAEGWTGRVRGDGRAIASRDGVDADIEALTAALEERGPAWAALRRPA